MLTGLGMYYSDSPVGIPAVMRHFLRNVDAMHQVWAFTQAWGSVRAVGKSVNSVRPGMAGVDEPISQNWRLPTFNHYSLIFDQGTNTEYKTLRA